MKLTMKLCIILYEEDPIPISGMYDLESEHIELKAFINILNRKIKNIKSNPQSNTNNMTSEDKFDKLIKLGNMYEKGLLSDEEFASLKKELLIDNNDTGQIENNIKHSSNFCKNCGVEVSDADIFCGECGTKLE